MNSWLLDVLKLVVSPLVAAVLAVFFVQRHTARTQRRLNYIESLSKDIKETRERALAYWGRPASEDRLEDQAREARIKADIHSLYEVAAEYSQLYRPKGYPAQKVLPDLVSNFHTACTAGGFETDGRKADFKRYQEITKAANRLQTELAKGRV